MLFAVARVGRVAAVEGVVSRSCVQRAALVELVHQQHAGDLRPASMAGVGVRGGRRNDQQPGQTEQRGYQGQDATDRAGDSGPRRVRGGLRSHERLQTFSKIFVFAYPVPGIPSGEWTICLIAMGALCYGCPELFTRGQAG